MWTVPSGTSGFIIATLALASGRSSECTLFGHPRHPRTLNISSNYLQAVELFFPHIFPPLAIYLLL